MKAGVAIKPLKVSIRASDASFQQYSSGIYNNTACGTQHNHATLVVGWGVNSAGVEYWIMKNSWGSGWGEKGYINLQIIAGDGNCGVQMWPFYPNM
jgi:cathepsin L